MSIMSCMTWGTVISTFIYILTYKFYSENMGLIIVMSGMLIGGLIGIILNPREQNKERL